MTGLGSYRPPHGIHIGNSGRLYVTCDLPPSLLILTPARRALLRAIEIKHPPHMVTVTRDETKAYTANSGDGTVTMIDLRVGRALMDAAGKYGYIAVQAENKVLKFSIPDGKVVLSIPTRERPDRSPFSPGSRGAGTRACWAGHSCPASATEFTCRAIPPAFWCTRPCRVAQALPPVASALLADACPG